LTGCARNVDRAQHAFPEPAAHRQQRIIVDKGAAVFALRTDAGANQVAIDLAGKSLEQAFDAFAFVNLFGQNHAPGHGFDIGIGELDGDGKAVAQPLQQGHTAGQGGLTGSDQQQPAVQLLAQRFSHFLNLSRTLRAVADEKLHFVQDQHRAGQLAVAGENLADGLDKIGGRDILHNRKLVFENGAHFSGIGSEIGIDLFQGAGDDRTHIEIIQFGQQALAGFFHRSGDLIENPVLFKPEPEPGLGVRGRQIQRAKEDAEDGETDAFAPAGGKGAASGMQTAGAAAEGVQLLQKIGDFDRKMHQSARAGAVRSENRVDPEMAEHFQQMRLAAAEKAAHPGGRLHGGVHAAEVGLQDADQAGLVLAFADKMLQLEAKGCFLFFRAAFVHGCYAVVHQLNRQRIPLK